MLVAMTHQQLATGTLPGPISKTFGVEVRLPNILDHGWRDHAHA